MSFWHRHAIGNNEGKLSFVGTSFQVGRQCQPNIGSRWNCGRGGGGEWGQLVGHLALVVNERKIKVPRFQKFGSQILLEVLEEVWRSINIAGCTVLHVNDRRSIVGTRRCNHDDGI